LGGFFMVRSYYPSECHADYFDFERIEALKPAIEACGISTLSQSPMLGFHKQMDNRIKLLEEILSFRMQDLPPSPTKSSNLSETAEVPACNVPSRSPLPALAIAPETKLGTASSGLGTLEP